MNDGTIRVVLLGAIGVAGLLVVGYQVFMLRWSKQVARDVPLIVVVLRVANIVLLTGAAIFVIWSLAR